MRPIINIGDRVRVTNLTSRFYNRLGKVKDITDQEIVFVNFYTTHPTDVSTFATMTFNMSDIELYTDRDATAEAWRRQRNRWNKFKQSQKGK